mmetsp:Transcript_26111/g.53216  ORF Transcript_26111/g.53216 Transcript_26111/m.53216 type:complete len:233 (+) Transcript_26111:2618-3316(+)
MPRPLASTPTVTTSTAPSLFPLTAPTTAHTSSPPKLSSTSARSAPRSQALPTPSPPRACCAVTCASVRTLRATAQMQQQSSWIPRLGSLRWRRRGGSTTASSCSACWAPASMRRILGASSRSSLPRSTSLTAARNARSGLTLDTSGRRRRQARRASSRSRRSSSSSRSSTSTSRSPPPHTPQTRRTATLPDAACSSLRPRIRAQASAAAYSRLRARWQALLPHPWMPTAVLV